MLYIASNIGIMMLSDAPIFAAQSWLELRQILSRNQIFYFL